MSSTVSSSSPDGSFINFLRQDSHGSNTFYPTSPISPHIRQQAGQPPLVQHSSSYSEDSQGMTRGLAATSPSIPQSRNSPSGTPNFAIDGRTSRSYSGDGFLPPPPNLEYNIDSMRQFEDPPFVNTPTKPPLSGGNMNRDRSYSSPGTNMRQLPIGAKSPLPPTNQTLFENKISSSWNDTPGFPSPSVYRSDATSNASAGDRFSSRPPRYGINRDVSPRADPFNLPSQSSYSNQNSSPEPSQNHVRSQSLAMGFGGSYGFDAFQGDMSNNTNNSFNERGITSM